MKDSSTRRKPSSGRVLLSVVLTTAILAHGIFAACDKEPLPDDTLITETAEFDVSGLRIHPTEVTEGESVEIRAHVVNRGKADGIFQASLLINGKEATSQDIDLSAGQSEDIVFSHVAEDTGPNNVTIDGLSGTFTVNKAATFEWSSLILTPPETEAGSTVVITAEVRNEGDVDGTCTAVLSINNETVDEEKVEVAAGKTNQVSFSFTADTPGTFDVAINGVSSTLEVSEPEAPEAAKVSIIKNDLIIDFPDNITFTLDCRSDADMVKVVLEYGTDSRSIVSEVSRIEPDFGEGKQVRTSWVWDMRKTGSLPSGANIWWRWRITHEDDSTFVTPKKTELYMDDRYEWKLLEATGMDFYWHGIGSDLINELTEDVELKLSRIELGIVIPEERKPEVFIYPSADELQSAILFSHEWTGALAFPKYNTVLIPVTSSNIEWAKRTLAHEVTHLIVGDFLFGPFGEIPTWLDEGLAQYAEGEMEDHQIEILEQAVKNNELISVQSLNSSFPSNPEEAYLAYAQSISLFIYLIDNYGWEKMKELLEVFKEGSTYDKALEKVYSFDTDGLEARWREQLQ